MHITDEEARAVSDASFGETFTRFGQEMAARQPSPYSASLPHIDLDPAAKLLVGTGISVLHDPATGTLTAVRDEALDDTAHAFDELEAWIAKSPGARSCWAIDKLNGKWRVGLMQDAERFSAGQDAVLRGAIRNALMIAKFAGCL